MHDGTWYPCVIYLSGAQAKGVRKGNVLRKMRKIADEIKPVALKGAS